MPETTVYEDFRFFFEPNAQVWVTMAFRFEGMEYIVNRIDWDVDSREKRVRASNSILQSADAPAMDGLCSRDPEGSSWAASGRRWTRAVVQEMTRNLAEQRMSRGIMTALDLADTRGSEIIRQITDAPEPAQPSGDEVREVAVSARPSTSCARFLSGLLGSPFASTSGGPVSYLDEGPAVTNRRALSGKERLFMFRNVARIEAEVAYLRNNSHTVCQVFQEAKRASLGYTTALEMALICLGRELEDARGGPRMFGGMKTAGDFAQERSVPVVTEDRPTARAEFVCPACGNNLRQEDGRVALRLNGQSHPSEEERALIFEGNCDFCDAELENVVHAGRDGTGLIRARTRTAAPPTEEPANFSVGERFRLRGRCPACDRWFLPGCLPHRYEMANDGAHRLHLDCPGCRRALIVVRNVYSATCDCHCVLGD